MPGDSGGFWIRVGDRSVNLDTGAFDDDARPLRPREAALLRYLVRNSGRTVTAEELLVEVWGFAPQVRSRTVVSTVHRLRQQIEPDPARPVHVVSASGGAYRWLAVRGPSTPLAPPAKGFGRVAERAEVRRALEAPHAAVTVTGPPGIGKSRTVREVAAASLLGGGAFLVDLDRVRTGDALRERICAALGARVTDDAGLVATLEARGPILLVFDDADDVIPVLRRWGPEVRDALPEVRWLVGSRRAVGWSGERVVVLGPLDASDARALLCDRRGAGSEGHDDAMQGLLAALEGNPLAIEVAARRLRSLPAAEVRRRMDGGSYVGGRSGLDDAIRSSWESIDASLVRAWGRLAAMPAPFDVGVAEAVLGPIAAEALDGLVANSLLWFDPGSELYRMPTSVRSFAMVHADPDERAEAIRLHGGYFAGSEARKRWVDQRSVVWSDPHLTFAWHQAMDRSDSEVAEGTARGLTGRSGFADQRRIVPLLERTLALPTLADRGALLCGISSSEITLGRLVSAERHAEMALSHYEMGSRAWSVAAVRRAFIWMLVGRMVEAEDALRQVIEVVQHREARRAATIRLASVLGCVGRGREAAEMLELLLWELRDEDEPFFTAWASTQASWEWLDHGRLARARELAKQVSELGDDFASGARYLLATCDLRAGAPSSAALHAGLGLAADRRLASVVGQSQGRWVSGLLAWESGQAALVEEHGRWLVNMGRSTGVVLREAKGHQLMALSAMASGRYVDAERHAASAVEAPHGLASLGAEAHLAEIWRRRGQRRTSVVWIDAAIERLGGTPAPVPFAELLVARAEVLLDEGDAAQANQHLVRADELRGEATGDLLGKLLIARARVAEAHGAPGADRHRREARRLLGDRTQGPLWERLEPTG